MTQEEFKLAIKNDLYLLPRKDSTEWELRLYLQEVEFHCPLCGKELQSRSQKKPSEKRFQIAHIFPNSPTKEQYETLSGLIRLGANSEAYENKIALCKDCHGTQDFHTTKEEYLKLVKIKQKCLQDTLLNDIVKTLSLEKEIDFVISKVINIDEKELSELNYEPVLLANKFYPNELLLKNKVAGYVSGYFPYIREQLRNLDGKNFFLFSVLSGQIKACFEKLEKATNDKIAIFNQMAFWIKNKTLSSSIEACEAVLSFFVQHCEVFREISK